MSVSRRPILTGVDPGFIDGSMSSLFKISTGIQVNEDRRGAGESSLVTPRSVPDRGSKELLLEAMEAAARSCLEEPFSACRMVRLAE